MLTLTAIAVIEGLFFFLPQAGLPPDMVVAVMCLAFLSIGWASLMDLDGGYLRRLGYMLSIAWFCSALPRWAVHVEVIHSNASSETGIILGTAFLVVAPLSLLIAPLIYGVGFGYAYARSRRIG